VLIICKCLSVIQQKIFVLEEKGKDTYDLKNKLDSLSDYIHKIGIQLGVEK
jgi:hypothetical protein